MREIPLVGRSGVPVDPRPGVHVDGDNYGLSGQTVCGSLGTQGVALERRPQKAEITAAGNGFDKSTASQQPELADFVGATPLVGAGRFRRCVSFEG